MREFSSLLLETRDEVILRHLELFMRAANISEETLAMRVHQLLLDRTPERARVASDFPLKTEPFHVQKEGGQKIRRWSNPEVSARPSIGVEEALILAMDEPYRQHCNQELAMRLGGYFVPCPDAKAPAVTSIADFLREVSEAVTCWAPLAADGQIDGRDDPAKLKEAVRQVEDVIAQALQLKDMLLAGLAAAEMQGGPR